MSKCLRYQKRDIQDHLASQYVLGTLSNKCRRRLEKLSNDIPALEERIYDWQRRMAPVHDSTPEITPPKKVWRELQKLSLSRDQDSFAMSALWSSIGFWRRATALALCALTLLLFLPVDREKNTPFINASYIASLRDVQGLESNGASPSYVTSEPRFVITAYKGNETKKSTLRLQWNQRQQKTSLKELTIWASSRNDGTLTSLGSVSLLKDGREMNKSEWAVIKNSAELLIIEGTQPNGNVRYRGPCLQLESWQLNNTQKASF